MIRPLSARHQEIIRLVASGYHNKEIGQVLGIDAQTVKNHLTTIFSRAGVLDRTQLTIWAFKWEILSVDEAYATMTATFEIEETAE